MLIYSVSVSVDGYIAGRDGSFGWSAPSDELFAFHLDRVRELGAHVCGRRLYQTMLPWENDPALRRTELDVAFAETWSALPKIVFSRTLDTVQGHARLATGTVGDEIAAVLASTDKDVEVGGAELAGAAFELGLVDEVRIFRAPVVVGGGTRHLPPVTTDVALELAGTRTFDPGVVYERYRVRRTDVRPASDARTAQQDPPG